MDYFRINTSPTVDMSYCILDDEPAGTNKYRHRMARGYAMGDKYPQDATWQMSDEFPGIKLPSLIATTGTFLVVERRLKEVFERTGVPMECLHFTLHDHQGREASRDYFLLNPLGTFDCLHLEKSVIVYSKEVPGKIVNIKKHVLATDKLRSAPDFFRIQENPYVYVLSHRLVEELRQLNPTNVYLTQLEQG